MPVWLLKYIGMLSPLSWLLVAAGVVLAACTFTGVQVYEHVTSKYEGILLKQKVSIIERTLEVKVLDEETLTRERDRAFKRGQADERKKRELDEIITKREAAVETTGKPWCELDAVELRYWNDSNANLFRIDLDSGILRDVPGKTAPSDVGETRPPVAK